MESFAMNLTLMQATIVEQQITNFVLENEYEKELGIITEDGKLKAAGKWIKERIDQFIGIIKSWWAKIMHFLTKTLPEWAAKKKKWLLEVFHIHQKAVKVDDSKINESDREKVKETCKKASRINIFKFAKNKKKDKDNDSLSSDLKDLTDSLEKAVKKGEEIHKKAENDFKKMDEDQKKNEEFDKQAEKNLQEAKDFLKNLENKSDNPSEKAELKKAADAIEQGKTVDIASEKLDYLEGYLIDIDKVKEYYSFCTSFGTAMYRTIMGPQLRLLVNIQNSDGDYFETGDPNSDIKVINGQLKELNEYGSKYKSYFDAKKEKDINISEILQKKNKIKLAKQNVEKELNSRKNSLDITNIVANDMKKSVQELVSALENFKSRKEVNQQLLARCISMGNQFMKDMTAVLEDCTKINAAIINGYENFLATAKPC